MSANSLQVLQQAEVDAYIVTDKGKKPHQTPLTDSEHKRVKAFLCLRGNQQHRHPRYALPAPADKPYP
ncbi:MAG: hypothetical protein KGZ80_00785 [Methylomonas sp.]|nr:hypothetical protein [Methylomonas sp.]PPD25817.1 MAG: hypothetical protein CTY22_07215 [Methylomonas sp.]PPD37276.1 MAG: hypothetical protein CTY21_07215 [Methylomonas sp.]PPD39042.1 MAG: hypothetical protein CTY17_08555 [Methylomonas sp.]PPD52988.1 MAG: hypothetical protein CTY11_07545 [Methylomonas sp.]